MATIRPTYDMQINKAEQLEAIAQNIADQILEVDNQITRLVKEGLKGEAVESAAATYIENRKVINEFIKRFARTAQAIYEDAERTKKVEMELMQGEFK